jgi:(1->4)-alpha-D-glucan 1-alpha-D-glucosylmutase
MVKAARESKAATSWMNPNADYERALNEFVANVLGNPGANAFVRDFASLADTVAFFGHLNSLAQTVLKLTAPGIPDFYQGTELLDFSLVDPDNRRPVDYELLQRSLGHCLALSSPPVPGQEGDEHLAKLCLTRTLLDLRRRNPDLFSRGTYEPLRLSGERADHLCAFLRSYESDVCLVIVPRWIARLMRAEKALPLGASVWGDTKLEIESAQFPSALTNCLTGRELRIESTVPIGDILDEFPFAILTSPRGRGRAQRG